MEHQKHLIVIQHGLWGTPRNTAFLAGLLLQRFPDHVVLNSHVNSNLATYDGIDLCGDRLVALILEEVQKHAALGKPVTRISFIGYSMGGLITRYVAGKLLTGGFFARVQPCAFITIATPHLGSWRLPVNILNRTFNKLVPVVTSRSGTQLMLADAHAFGRPLLALLTHPDLPFMRALRRFPRLMVMANVHHDRPVPYKTAAIRLDSPYDTHRPYAPDPRYPSIVRPGQPIPPKRCGSAKSRPASAKRRGGAAQVVQAAGPGAEGGAAAGEGQGGQQQRALPAAAAAPAAASPLGQQEAAATAASAAEAQAAAAAAAAAPPRGGVKGKWMRAALVVLLPLAIPVMLLMTVAGKRHAAQMKKRKFDHAWITDSYRGYVEATAAAAAAQQQRQKAGGQSAAAREGGGGDGAMLVEADIELALLALGEADEPPHRPAAPPEQECPSPYHPAGAGASGQAGAGAGAEVQGAGEGPGEALLGRSSSFPGTASERLQAALQHPSASAGDLSQQGGPGGQAAAAAATGAEDEARGALRRAQTLSPAPGSSGGDGVSGGGGGGDDDAVSVDDVRLDEGGLVTAPGSLHHMQEWLCARLSELPWHKVDVDVRHFHAHAAIIVRNPRRFADNVDVLTYLADRVAEWEGQGWAHQAAQPQQPLEAGVGAAAASGAGLSSLDEVMEEEALEAAAA